MNVSEIADVEVKSNNPKAVSINSKIEMFAWLKKFEEYAHKENKTLGSRQQIKNNKRKPENIEYVEVLDKDSEEFNKLFDKFNNHSNTTLPVTEIVKIDEKLEKAFYEEDMNKIPPMYDDFMRSGDEKISGFMTEVALEQLLYNKQDELDVYMLDDDNHLHCGDALINGHIIEIKGSQMKSSAVNLTGRYHGQSYTPLMEIKSGVMADAYSHNYILKDNINGGYYIGIVGLAHTDPNTGGTLSFKPEIIHTNPPFPVMNQLQFNFEPISKEGLENLKGKINHYPSTVNI